MRTIVVAQDKSYLSIDLRTAQLYSDRAIRAAGIFLTISPVLIVYPLLQPYFITGSRLGPVKE
jgi:ABC-type glycerol-3-phosphate transport system permease component